MKPHFGTVCTDPGLLRLFLVACNRFVVIVVMIVRVSCGRLFIIKVETAGMRNIESLSVRDRRKLFGMGGTLVVTDWRSEMGKSIAAD